MLNNTSDENFFLKFLIILQKHVHMGSKFIGTLKSSICFNLKHVFMYLKYFIQVPKVPLITM